MVLKLKKTFPEEGTCELRSEGNGLLDEEGKAFQAEGTARAKAQWQKRAW